MPARTVTIWLSFSPYDASGGYLIGLSLLRSPCLSVVTTTSWCVVGPGGHFISFGHRGSLAPSVGSERGAWSLGYQYLIRGRQSAQRREPRTRYWIFQGHLGAMSSVFGMEKRALMTFCCCLLTLYGSLPMRSQKSDGLASEHAATDYDCPGSPHT